MPTQSYPLRTPERLEERDVPAANFADYPILPVYDDATLGNVRRIARIGEFNGQRENAFMKVGDSNTAANDAMTALGSPIYNPVASGLANYGPDVMDAWQRYRQPVDPLGYNSFARNSAAAQGGYGTLQMLSKLDQEMSVTRAGVALILTGTNDQHFGNYQGRFREYLGAMIARLSSQGIVPILSTIPWDRLYGLGWDASVAEYNQIIVDVAEQHRVPVINLWRAINPLPNSGLKFTDPFVGRDYRHLSSSPNQGGFNAFDLAFGQNLRTLITLQALSQIRNLAFADPAPVELSQTWEPLNAGQAVFATGSDFGGSAIVTIQDGATGRVVNRLAPFGSSFRGGVNVALGDLTGDGVADVVAAPGLGGGPIIRTYDGIDGHELSNFFAFEAEFRGGVTVAVGDADADGQNDIAVGTGVGGAPRVRVFRPSNGAATLDFYAFDSSFRSGVNVAVGGTDGGWIAAGAGVGGSPSVGLFSGRTGANIRSFAAFDESQRGGVNVAAGDVTGDGRDDVVVGAGVGSVPVVKVIDPLSLQVTSSFAAGDPTTFDGVRVGVLQYAQRVVTAPARGLTRGGRVYAADGTEHLSESATDRGLEPYSGIYVGA